MFLLSIPDNLTPLPEASTLLGQKVNGFNELIGKAGEIEHLTLE
jgi:hypothetical protein